jgi:transcription elongation factor GreB
MCAIMAALLRFGSLVGTHPALSSGTRCRLVRCLTMSRAFVKESDGAVDALPELAVSAHPNWVTPTGLAQLHSRVDSLENERAAARAAAEIGTADAAVLARIERDLRYFRVRLASARVVTPSTGRSGVHFGSTVTLAYPDGRSRLYRIVGEDEADPSVGLLSWVAPLARALEGFEPGDTLDFADLALEVVSVAP